MSWRIEIFACAFCMLFACAPTPEVKTPISAAATSNYLMEPEILLQRISREHSLKLIDFRKPSEYAKGHIHGATDLWRDDLEDTSYTYGGMMPPSEQMASLLGSMGISAKDTIVIYDDRAAANAARLWWILKYYGHENMFILNGGLKAWSSFNGPLVKENSQAEPVQYSFNNSLDRSILATDSDIGKGIDNGVLLLDTREQEEHTGEILKGGAAHAGMIEGSRHLPWHLAVDYGSQDRFLWPDSIMQVYGFADLDKDTPIITYCHSGVRSAHTLFVLTELLGFKNVRNYDGSWIEWSHLHPIDPEPSL